MKTCELHVNGRFLTQPHSGVQEYGLQLLRHWDDFLQKGTFPFSGITVWIPSKARIGDGRMDGLHSVQVRRCGNVRSHLWEQVEFARACGPGLLFCPGNSGPVLLGKQQALALTLHDVLYLRHPGGYKLSARLLYRFLIPRALHKAALILAVSESEKKQILEHYPETEAKLKVVPMGCRSATVENSDYRPPTAKPYLLFVGSLHPRKNLQGFLDACHSLLPALEHDLVIVGQKGNGLASASITIPPALASRVHMISYLPENDLARLYSQAACFVFPSFDEGAGIPPLEALACGCPVVVSDIPSLRERCGSHAVYCDPHRIHSIAEGITKVLRLTEEERREDAQRGKDHALMFKWEKVALETMKHLSTLAHRGSP